MNNIKEILHDASKRVDQLLEEVPHDGERRKSFWDFMKASQNLACESIIMRVSGMDADDTTKK